MRGFVLLAYCFLLLSGFNAGKIQPDHLSFSPAHHVNKSLPLNDDNSLFTDEMEDEDERINNAIARRCKPITELFSTPPDLFDLNYLHGFTKDRLALGDLPDIYIAQRALRI